MDFFHTEGTEDGEEAQMTDDTDDANFKIVKRVTKVTLSVIVTCHCFIQFFISDELYH